jgi:NADH-quinone oxidoreductase subunit E
MVQIGKDYYEDLNPKNFKNILESLALGKVPNPGSQIGRYSSEPLKGLTSLTEYESGKNQFNASVQLAKNLRDTIKRINPKKVNKKVSKK